jgi:hypothetical protein
MIIKSAENSLWTLFLCFAKPWTKYVKSNHRPVIHPFKIVGTYKNTKINNNKWIARMRYMAIVPIENKWIICWRLMISTIWVAMRIRWITANCWYNHPMIARNSSLERDLPAKWSSGAISPLSVHLSTIATDHSAIADVPQVKYSAFPRMTS